MSQRTSPWRVNDAMLYDALRDEARLAVAELLTSADGRDERVADQITQLRSDLLDVNGFRRDEVAGKLNALRNAAGASHD